MDPSAQRALDRLQHPDGAALRQLARLVVLETTNTPIKNVASARWIASQVTTALEAVSRGEHARKWVASRIEEARGQWKDETRPLRHWMPKEAEAPLRQVLSRPWSPDEKLVHRIIDQPAVRTLVAELLEDTLVRFQKRLKSMDATGLGSLGMRAARKGRGFLGGMVNNLGGVAENLGGVAENIVGAVAEELEHAVHGRIREFVASTSGEAIKGISRHLADPNYTSAFGDLRVAVLDVLLDTPVKELALEADKLRPEELVDVVIGAIRSTLAEPSFVDDMEARISKILDSAGDGTLGAWLTEVDLHEVWTATTTELVTRRLEAVVRTPDFETWWAGLFAE